MKKVKASKIMDATKSFFIVRAMVYLVITLIMLVIGILGALLCLSVVAKNPPLALILAAVIFGGLLAFLGFAKRYCLYMIKAAHIAAITEYIKTGKVPVTKKGYKGVLAYGTEVIKNNFGAANIAFVADALISGATRQIMRWINAAENLLSFIPGAKMVFNFVNFILSTALNFIDEAILSYVFYHNEEKNGFKKTCDGLVYYAQSWKGMLKGAFKVGAFVWVLRIVSYIIFFSVVNMVGGFYAGLIIAFVLLYGIENILVDPYATCIMVNDYHKAIENQPLKMELYEKLCKASKRFKDIFNKSSEPLPPESVI